MSLENKETSYFQVRFCLFPHLPSKEQKVFYSETPTLCSVLVLGVKIRVKSLSVLPIKHEANARGGVPLAHRLSDRSAYGRGIPSLLRAVAMAGGGRPRPRLKWSGRIKDCLLYFFIRLFFCYGIHKSTVARCNMYHGAPPADVS